MKALECVSVATWWVRTFFYGFDLNLNLDFALRFLLRFLLLISKFPYMM